MLGDGWWVILSNFLSGWVLGVGWGVWRLVIMGIGCLVLGVGCLVLIGCWVFGVGCWVMGELPQWLCIWCWVFDDLIQHPQGLGVWCCWLSVGCWVFGDLVQLPHGLGVWY